MLTFVHIIKGTSTTKGRGHVTLKIQFFSIYAVSASSALTVHEFDADSAMGVSIITDDSSCWISDDDEVSEYMYVYHNATFVNEKSGLCLLSLSAYNYHTSVPPCYW